MRIYISTPADFNYDECLRFLNRAQLECLFFVENKQVIFSLQIDATTYMMKMYMTKKKLAVEDLHKKLNPKHKSRIKEYIQEWLDIDRDLSRFYQQVKSDKLLLYPICKKYKGLRLIGISNLVEAISWAIIGQQINLNFAYTLKRRLIENFGEQISYQDKSVYVFPKPEVIAKLTDEDLRPLQFSRSKIKYLTGVAQAIVEGKISKEILSNMTYDDAKAKLMQLKGVGNWTADYVLMKCLRFSDAFPISDVGVHNAIKFQLGLENKPSIEEIEIMAKQWQGWKSYATFYLWHSLLKN